MIGHRVTHRHDHDIIVSEIVCHEPSDGSCRWQAPGCDEHCSTCIWAPTCQEVCAHDPNIPHDCLHPSGSHCTRGHLYQPIDFCSLIDGIMNDGVVSCYSGQTGAEVHDGPVHIWYDDGGFHWEYRENLPALRRTHNPTQRDTSSAPSTDRTDDND